jgi:hypothetical protein
MLNLPNVTLICIDSTYQYRLAIEAVHWSMCQCNFGAVKFFTHHPIELIGAEAIHTHEIVGKTGPQSYSQFMWLELYKHLDTPYVITCQRDGHVINTDAWTDEFYNYDYIGSKWWINSPDIECKYNIGDGGFSMRSKKLMELVGTTQPRFQHYNPEDTALARDHRFVLENEYGIKYATEEIADKFSYHDCHVSSTPFGFHQVDNFYDRFKIKYGLVKEIEPNIFIIGPEANK